MTKILVPQFFLNTPSQMEAAIKKLREDIAKSDSKKKIKSLLSTIKPDAADLRDYKMVEDCKELLRYTAANHDIAIVLPFGVMYSSKRTVGSFKNRFSALQVELQDDDENIEKTRQVYLYGIGYAIAKNHFNTLIQKKLKDTTVELEEAEDHYNNTPQQTKLTYEGEDYSHYLPTTFQETSIYLNLQDAKNYFNTLIQNINSSNFKNL